MGTRARLSDPALFATLITAERRIEVVRRGAQLTLRAIGRALTEAEAREVSERQLNEGEQLLNCIERDGTRGLSYSFTFVVWPKPTSHTGRILEELQAA